MAVGGVRVDDDDDDNEGGGGDEGRRSDKGPAWRRTMVENIVVMRRTSEGWGCMLVEI